MRCHRVAAESKPADHRPWVTTDEAVHCVFVNAALPGATWMSGIDVNTGVLGKESVFGHFAALVIRHGTTHIDIEALQNGAKGMSGFVCGAVVEFNECHVKGRTLD